MVSLAWSPDPLPVCSLHALDEEFGKNLERGYLSVLVFEPSPSRLRTRKPQLGTVVGCHARVSLQRWLPSQSLGV